MDAIAFARRNPDAVLATIKSDGTPQWSLLLVGVDSQDRLVISTRETAMKTLNVRRDPERGCVCSMTGSSHGLSGEGGQGPHAWPGHPRTLPPRPWPRPPAHPADSTTLGLHHGLPR